MKGDFMATGFKNLSKYIYSPYFIFIILSILVQTIGAVGAKYGVNNVPGDGLFSIHGNLIIALFLLITMGLQALIWQKALVFYPLSFAYPFRSLVNFTVLVSAFFLFDESVTAFNILGLILITLGIYLLVRVDEI
jgi:multidrug transporter EmrE-like cation transporter